MRINEIHDNTFHSSIIINTIFQFNVGNNLCFLFLHPQKKFFQCRNFLKSELIAKFIRITEIQFCKLSTKRKVTERVALRSIQHWQNDSLYVDDEDLFYNEYRCIFDTMDIFGMKYYGAELIKPIIEKLIKVKPKDYEILVEWLNKAEAYTGFYILGL